MRGIPERENARDAVEMQTQLKTSSSRNLPTGNASSVSCDTVIGNLGEKRGNEPKRTVGGTGEDCGYSKNNAISCAWIISCKIRSFCLFA